MKTYKAPAAGDQNSVKVYALFGQPKKFDGMDGSVVPPLPSMNVDTYWGSDMGYNLNTFYYNVQSVTYDPNISLSWAAGGGVWTQAGFQGSVGKWDGSVQPELPVTHTPEYAYNALTPISYNRVGNPLNVRHFASQQAYGYGLPNTQLGFAGYQTPWAYGNYDNALNIPVSPVSMNAQSLGLSNPFDYLNDLNGLGASNPEYESWRGSPVASVVPVGATNFIPANNGNTKSWPATTKDLANYSKSISKVVIVQTDYELLNGYVGCKRANQFGQCIEWSYSSSTTKRRALCLRPENCWSQHVDYGPEQGKTHSYEGDDDFTPINPPYIQNCRITTEWLPERVPVSTNPAFIEQLRMLGCHDDIVTVDYVDPNGNAVTAQIAYASIKDANTEARKRTGGVPAGYEEECIILCDSEGNEKEGLILFKEEDCDPNLEVGEPTTPTTPPGGGGGGSMDPWICVPAVNPTTGQQQQPGCAQIPANSSPPGQVVYDNKQQCLNNCGGGGGTRYQCMTNTSGSKTCVQDNGGPYASLLECQGECAGGGGAGNCPCLDDGWVGFYSSEWYCAKDHCVTMGTCCNLTGGGGELPSGSSTEGASSGGQMGLMEHMGYAGETGGIYGSQ